jgi:hypothetical protein
LSRRGFRTVNLPIELCEWIDKYCDNPPGERPLGMASRDEFVRFAVALVIMATKKSDAAVPPLKILAELIRRLEE